MRDQHVHSVLINLVEALSHGINVARVFCLSKKLGVVAVYYRVGGRQKLVSVGVQVGLSCMGAVVAEPNLKWLVLPLKILERQLELRGLGVVVDRLLKPSESVGIPCQPSAHLLEADIFPDHDVAGSYTENLTLLQAPPVGQCNGFPVFRAPSGIRRQHTARSRANKSTSSHSPPSRQL